MEVSNMHCWYNYTIIENLILHEYVHVNHIIDILSIIQILGYDTRIHDFEAAVFYFTHRTP